MKYMLMLNTIRESGGIPAWSRGDLEAHMDFMHALNRELQEAGERVLAEGLASPEQARLVRAGKNGVPDTDGVFPESKEFLAGFWIVDVETAERAYAIAAKALAAPGPGGPPLNMPIEVRALMSAPPREMV